MTNLVVRKIPWEFDASVPFMWQPANPNFGLFCNAFTFIAVPFERYIVNVVRKAQDKLNEDPDVAAEAEAFLRQEAQHAAAHRKHMIALVQRYPELERCYEDACRAYDDLIDEQPIEFHAAYIANLEATFTPLFKVILDNRDSLFGGGDQRVASLMMWHFVEEIEHRSSGLMLCRHINPDPWYRVQAHPGHVQPRRQAVPSRSQRFSTRSFRSRTAAPRRNSCCPTRCCSVSSPTAGPAAVVDVPVAVVRRRFSTPSRPANCSRWCGGCCCRRRRITIRPINRCRIGRTPGCVNTSGVVT